MKFCYRCMEERGEEIVCPHCGHDSRITQDIPYALQPGTILNGKYLIGNVLGQGGFGITYIGFDLALEIKVAIKEYYIVGGASRIGVRSQEVYWLRPPDNMNHFLTEARRMAILQKMPEIAHVRNVLHTNNTAYIIMEYVKGESLKQYLQKNGTIPYEQMVKLMLPVIAALGQVHEKGIVHRDISPDNLMMEPEGTLRVLDLGAAGDLNRNEGRASQLVVRHGFSPYEQYVETGEIGPWTDVYALCATMYYCCTGKVIPDAFARVDRYMQTQNIELDMDQVIPSVGAEVLQKGLTIDVANRIPNMEELAEQLKKSLEKGNSISYTRKTKPKDKEGIQHSKIRKWLLTGAAVMMAAVIGAVIHAGTGMDEKTSRLSVPEETEDNLTAVQTEDMLPTVETYAEVPVVLDIAKTIDLNDVELGYSEAVKILSGPSADEISWSSSNSQVVEVSPSGIIIAVGFGSAQITAEYEGQSVACNVNVMLKGNVECRFKENLTGWTITGYRGELPEKLVLPKQIDGKLVTEIGWEVFSRCTGLTSVTIPDSIAIISEGTFSGCTGLTSVTIPNSVTEIKENAFKDCTGLTRIILPDNLMQIKADAFSGCTGLTRVIIPDSVTKIGKSVFEGCTNLTGVTIGNGLDEIEDSAFRGCTKLSTVSIGDNVTILGNNAFQDCINLTSIVIPEKATTIKVHAFSGCYNLSSVTIPESVNNIGWYAFEKCHKLKQVKFRKGCDYFVTSFPEDCAISFY